ncbi:hypothetical protein [Streptosporangium sp. NPDC023615]|uniref:hypothetical protein n=1 Tax=Streptosporangium sp. NPDC023615 TaxID=3154794 RepID=UPI003414041F
MSPPRCAAAGHPDAAAEKMVAVLRHIRLERGREPTGGVPEVLGRPPLDFAGYVARTEFGTG